MTTMDRLERQMLARADYEYEREIALFAGYPRVVSPGVVAVADPPSVVIPDDESESEDKSPMDPSSVIPVTLPSIDIDPPSVVSVPVVTVPVPSPERPSVPRPSVPPSPAPGRRPMKSPKVS